MTVLDYLNTEKSLKADLNKAKTFVTKPSSEELQLSEDREITKLLSWILTKLSSCTHLKQMP